MAQVKIGETVTVTNQFNGFTANLLLEAEKQIRYEVFNDKKELIAHGCQSDVYVIASELELAMTHQC